MTANFRDSRFELDPGRVGIKLSILVRKNPVILQVAENYPPTFGDESYTGMLLEQGLHSRIFPTPFTAFQVKLEDEGPADIDFVAYE